MAVIGFNFTKMSAEKKGVLKGEIKVSNTFTIKDVSEAKLDLGGKTKKQSGLRYSFEFVTTYAPNMGSISLAGDVVDMLDNKDVQAILKEWKDTKKLPDEKTLGVYNTALGKCSVQVIIISKEMGLPLPIPLLRKGV